MTLDTLIETVQRQVTWAPQWAFSLVVMALALVAALAVHEIIVRIVRRGLSGQDAFWRALVVRTRAPGRLAMVVVALSAAATASPLSDGQGRFVQHALLIAFIVLLGWVVLTATDVASALYLRRYRVDVADNLLARKHLTQVRILQRALATLVVIVTAAMALMTISEVRQWGVSLLAAGGAAGIIVGLALQPLLSNLIAGVQIATTQPIRLDDQVIVESEFGNVEEITATYVVVRLWDQRRMVLPLTYFLTKPFQNWTRESAQLMGTVMLYLDYTTPVEPLRAKLKALLEATPLWDGRVMACQVTDARERTMEIRCLMSAADAGRMFDLRCLVREQLIGWLQATYPGALPRDRLELGPQEGWSPSLSRNEPTAARPQ
jgi:small-conductance mechanosensitive channel